MGVTFRRYTWSSALPRMAWLFPLHFEECGEIGGGYDVDVDNYARCDQIGALRVYLAESDAVKDKAVGYAIFRLARLQRKKGKIAAWGDTMFVHKDARVGRIGTEFIKFCDACLAEDGVYAVHQSVRGERDWSPVLLRLGYEPLERVFVRRL